MRRWYYKSLIPFGRSSSLARSGETDPFTNMRREMDRMFDDFTRDWPLSLRGGGSAFLSPKVNVAETDKGLELTAELPGIDQNDIELDLSEGVLTLKAEHKIEKEEKNEAKRYHLVERSYGTFLRRFALPFEADQERIEASFDKGVLKVTIPRAPHAEKQGKKIAIQGN